MQFELIGKSLSYSLSKRIHNRIYDKLGIQHSYELHELDSNELQEYFDMRNFNGINVTIPYKTNVIQYIAQLDKVSNELQSVNTIKNIDGKLYGYNTDIVGFDLSCKKFSINFNDKDVVILGTGATSKMIYYYVKKHNAKSIKFVSRNGGDYSYDEIFYGDILINTTPLGTGENDQSPVSEDVIINFETLIDLTYNPMYTRFLRYGLFNKKRVMNGLYMLVAQAVKAEEIFLCLDIDNIVIDEIYNEIISELNIVIIGMMGSGKTTIGTIVAESLNKNFIDIDTHIEHSTKQTINELFKDGENYFRMIESNCINEISNEKNSVISCGGGVVLNEENIHVLAKHSIIIGINRNIDNIIEDIDISNRPLINDKENDLHSIYSNRKPLYERYSQVMFENNNEISSIVEEILRWYYE